MSKPDENGWEPIKTAPRDGTYVWLSNGMSMRIGFWMNGQEFEHLGSVGGGWRDFSLAENGFAADLHFQPTHWQPTPNLPVANNPHEGG